MPEISPALYRAGEGEPLVLLHGFTGAWHHWRPLLAELVARFEVIAPTLAGHEGGPPFPNDGPASLDDGADSLESHLDELGVGTAHFVGNSMGGALALELAKRGRARSVVALSPGGGWREGSPEGKRIGRFFARQDRLARATLPRNRQLMRRPGMRHVAFRDIMRHGELVSPAEAYDMQRSAVNCELVPRVIDALLERRGRARIEGLDQIACPVLVAWAQHDRILRMPSCSERFREEIPGVDFRILPGCGHVPMWDAPRALVAMISEWVESHSSSGAPAAEQSSALV